MLLCQSSLRRGMYKIRPTRVLDFNVKRKETEIDWSVFSYNFKLNLISGFIDNMPNFYHLSMTNWCVLDNSKLKINNCVIEIKISWLNMVKISLYCLIDPGTRLNEWHKYQSSAHHHHHVTCLIDQLNNI